MNGVDGDPDDDPTALELRQHVAQREGAGLRVELVPTLDQAGCCSGVEVGAERHHQDVGLERARLRRDPPSTGSIELTAAWTNCTPGITTSR